MQPFDQFEQVGTRGFYRPLAVVTFEQALEMVAQSMRVTREEIIDPQKIGVLMAQNRGVSGDVFGSETEALAWLDARL